MTAFATTTELENRLRRTVDTVAAEALLDEASSLIVSVVGHSIVEVEDDEMTLRGNWTRRLDVPAWPVTAVASVTLDGTLLTEGTDYTWQADGAIWRPRAVDPTFPTLTPMTVGAHWGGPDVDVVVVATHGLTTCPAWVRAICLDVVARAYVSPDGVVREQIDSYSVTYSQGGFNQAGGVNLIDSEERKLRRLRKPSR